MRRRLDGLASPIRDELPQLGERACFIRTPTKILLELVFRDTKRVAFRAFRYKNPMTNRSFTARDFRCAGALAVHTPVAATA